MDLYFQHFHLNPVEIQSRQKYMYKRKFPQTMIAPTLNFNKNINLKVFDRNFETPKYVNLERKRVQLLSKNEIKSFLNGV